MTDARYPSKERVERDSVLVYAEGDDIPETDQDELRRQGYLTGDAKPKAKPAGEPTVKKVATPTTAQPAKATKPAKKASSRR